MAQSNAERQAAYRARQQAQSSPCERLNIMVSLQAKRSLERLAACYGVTQRTLLERTLADAERLLLSQLKGREDDYYDKRLKLDNCNVTQ